MTRHYLSLLFFFCFCIAINGNAQEKPVVIQSTAVKNTFLSIEDRQLKSATVAANTGNSFRAAAARALPGVVHILAAYMPGLTKPADPLTTIYDDALWTNSGTDLAGALVGSASGVILTEDGLIVTGFHCVKGALRLEVVLSDRRVYKAVVLGVDTLSDLALLKIDEKKLPFVQLGNIDSLQVGDWVMSVGYPLNLASSVTAGVVSAKARYMGDVFMAGGIATFIQTDAVMNEGSSGGALVDINGSLVGVNSGIITTTSLYAGYCFAVPVNIVSRVCNDLLQYGKVQRAFMGAVLKNVADRQGVWVDSTFKNGSADRAGILAGDIITGINNRPVSSLGALQDILLLYRPGNKVLVTIMRKNELLIRELLLAPVN